MIGENKLKNHALLEEQMREKNTWQWTSCVQVMGRYIYFLLLVSST